jgi:hypothetical protein
VYVQKKFRQGGVMQLQEFKVPPQKSAYRRQNHQRDTFSFARGKARMKLDSGVKFLG